MTGPVPVSLAQCYALRRTNPFRGVAAVVKTPTGRALSIDGLEWQVQVLAHPPKGLWNGAPLALLGTAVDESDDALRRQLEGQTVHRALLVDAIWRLYPRILDQNMVNRARVEARLRRASV